MYETLLQAAYRFVSFRPRSEREITEFLEKKIGRSKTIDSATIVRIIERLRECGYADDRKFVQWWIEQRNSFRPKGIIALKSELLGKGISRSLIEEILDSSGEGEGAKKVIQKKLVLWAQKPISEQKKKVYTFLAQRGFSSGTIRKIIDGLGKKDYN